MYDQGGCRVDLGGVKDDMIPDSKQDIKPGFHKSRTHSQQHSIEENDDDVRITVDPRGGGLGWMGGGVEDDMIPDSEQDIKPRFHKSRTHSQQLSVEENDDEVCLTRGEVWGGWGECRVDVG